MGLPVEISSQFAEATGLGKEEKKAGTLEKITEELKKKSIDIFGILKDKAKDAFGILMDKGKDAFGILKEKGGNAFDLLKDFWNSMKGGGATMQYPQGDGTYGPNKPPAGYPDDGAIEGPGGAGGAHSSPSDVDYSAIDPNLSPEEWNKELSRITAEHAAEQLDSKPQYPQGDGTYGPNKPPAGYRDDGGIEGPGGSTFRLDIQKLISKLGQGVGGCLVVPEVCLETLRRRASLD